MTIREVHDDKNNGNNENVLETTVIPVNTTMAPVNLFEEPVHSLSPSARLQHLYPFVQFGSTPTLTISVAQPSSMAPSIGVPPTTITQTPYFKATEPVNKPKAIHIVVDDTKWILQREWKADAAELILLPLFPFAFVLVLWLVFAVFPILMFFLLTLNGLWVVRSVSLWLCNSTCLSIQNGELRVYNHPFSNCQREKVIAIRNIQEVVCQRNEHADSDGDAMFTYSVLYRDSSGNEDDLVRGLRDTTHALYIQQELDKVLGLGTNAGVILTAVQAF